MNKAWRNELGWLAAGAGALCLALGKRRAAGALGAVAAGLVLPRGQTFDFSDRVVVITGGSRGLGLALAFEVLARGGRVALIARDASELAAAAARLSNADRVGTFVADVTDNARVGEVIAEVTERFGTIDAWINNAGAITVGPFESMDERDFEAQLNLHLRAVIGITQRLTPYFRERGGGRIVNVSSIGGLVGMPHLSAYCTSKHALAGFGKAIAPELAVDNITCTTVYPGLMRTGSPVQAVFKGDHQREYEWFAAADNLPGLSLSARAAAKRILNASARGHVEVVIGVSARLAEAARAALPETFALALRTTARVLPDRQSHARRTGADIRALAEPNEPLRAIAARHESEWNQVPKYDAERALGQS